MALGATPLTSVTLVDATTLTATVPWGIAPGTYDLTVTDPDGGSGSLSGAFTVGAGIGQWNPGDLFGGQMQQLLMKPGDPSTLYATAYGLDCSAAATPASTGPLSPTRCRPRPTVLRSIRCTPIGSM